MKRSILTLALMAAGLVAVPARAQLVDDTFPQACKWLSSGAVAFSEDGSFTDSTCFRLDLKRKAVTRGIQAPERYASFPIEPEGAVNLSYSPDSTMLAFTRDNDLWIVRIADGKETRLTFDGSKTVYNGYASWVYFEEIFGRPSKYRAFWWSPDSKRLAFYRFDDTEVPMFPIYSPFGQDGTLRETHYPKAGERNPEVRIGFAEIGTGALTWADFDPAEDQYFGIPFWSDDSRTFYVPWEPRIQQTLKLFGVDPVSGAAAQIYQENVETWLNWPEEMLFASDGLYMVRDFETGWQQIYFLSYDGTVFRRLTDGPNWRISLQKLGPDGSVYFLAERDSRVSRALYRVSKKGKITAMTDPRYDVSRVSFAPDMKHFVYWRSALDTPPQLLLDETARPQKAPLTVAAETFEDWRTAPECVGQLITMTTRDGLELPGIVFYPDDFDPGKQYPVHVDIYGGPDTPMVNGRWMSPNRQRFFTSNGIIELIADCRAAGHNGRAGLDRIYKHLNTIEVSDFIEWAHYLQSLPYVRADKIGVEGFSFGGTMTTTLLLTASDCYHYGIAGGGVYDWMLYDSHYTERFMSTPEDNPEGYRDSRVIGYVEAYPVPPCCSDGKVMLKITHGTGDDNVHFQNTLQLIDALQRSGKGFELMIYPDAKHGYLGEQGVHSTLADYNFWKKYLLDE